MTGRNEHCPCGSGKRYRNCCGRLGRSGVPGECAAGVGDPPAMRVVELLEAGDFSAAETQAVLELRARPCDATLWQALAVARGAQRKDPLEAWQRACEYAPRAAESHLNLGNALARHGRLAEAGASYARALALRPRCALTLTNLAELQLELGNVGAAAESCRRALIEEPDRASTHCILGEAFAREGRHGEALQCARRAIELEPGSARAHRVLGYSLAKLARPDEALAALERALSLDPSSPDAQFRCAQLLRSLGRLEQAEACFGRALELAPNWLAAHTELATVLRLQGRREACETQCRAALALDEESCEAQLVLAELRADEGDFCGAEELFRRVIALDRDSTAGWAGIARVRRMSAADGAWLSAALRVAGSAQEPRQLPLCFALGKYYDDLGDTAAAFDHYSRANALAKRCAPVHDRSHLTRATDRLIRCEGAAWLDRVRSVCPGSERAVFIVGMPRSGTTLLEQILASHPAVCGAGELTFWGEHAGEILLNPDARPGALTVERDPKTLARLGEEYLATLRRHSSQAARVVNKWPANFWFTGVIHAALPAARLIHLRRHPIDTCLSIYFQHFEAVNAYANDLEDLAQYYRDYERVMRHWRRVLPHEQLFELSYEELVSDQRASTRALLEFLGLPWDERCMEFHRAPRSVITASRWQVRQKLYASSVGRWRRYAAHLGPLASLAPQASG
ncbi:MAG TPA: sulfotransferase [Steroidobacteraceae bacterium]|nr:sulfotransferase [Steroidobacteraceae bacterium]